MSEKLANPAPLGLACFALTTFLLSVVNAELAQKDLIGAVVSCALVYGGVVQILAGMWEIKAGSTFGGVACFLFFWGILDKLRFNPPTRISRNLGGVSNSHRRISLSLDVIYVLFMGGNF